MGDIDKGLVAGRTPGVWGADDATRLGGGDPPHPPKDWNAIHHYKHPKTRKLQCCFFWAKNTTQNNAPGYVSAARKLLKEHNLDIDVCGGVEKTAERTIPMDEKVDISHEETLFDQARKLHSHDGHVPVIFCRFAGAMGGESDTNGVAVKLEGKGQMVLINVDNTSADNVTLLHELGHVADCGHVKSTPDDAFPNFMSYPPPNRTGILRNQVIRLAESMMAVDG